MQEIIHFSFNYSTKNVWLIIYSVTNENALILHGHL